MTKTWATPSDFPSPLVYPLPDNARLIEILAAILDKPQDWVRNILYEEERSLGSYLVRDFQDWGLEPHEWSDRLVEFYRHSHMGLIGNPVWNRRAAKLQMRSWIGRYLARDHPSRFDILMVGDGSGFDSLFLAQCGHRVTYSEDAATSRAFARRIFADAGAEVRVTATLQEVAGQTFDVIVCLDVLEHVPDPPALVAQFARLLRPGGRLIVHAPFFFVTWHNPTHLRANRRYSGDLRRLYHANGFHMIDGNLFWDPLVLAKPHPLEPVRPASRLWRLFLRLGGLLLMLARWWNWPHNLIAVRAMQKADPKWLIGLAPAQLDTPEDAST